ncbi:transcriptional activator protein-like protein acu-15 [Sporormia fimetaria CBS 119925]|uniref:Transcriptional activator protein-like protein acu-15 n=1 Tax=Sporormia fimetaria CBS 119925 TaxID=1340428 RepID=A0A6A6VE85_9PLEO|nr:transcriptional activator protein-like protein acu-15 [Sporormia fimetaria CBS 119925]
MPGILPMKVIKVGSNAQTRIAQACDRCRSKKIRCDGIRPSCTQCVNVGFECKTSDKLSRRAFPRGYTESLEERVRCLEAEVRELKELLDEKDEKIDMLSRIHTHTVQGQPTPRRTTTSPSPAASPAPSQEKEDVFKIQQSPALLDDENHDSYFVGSSSGRTLIEAFKQRAQESGRPCPDLKSSAFFAATKKAAVPSSPKRGVSYKAPPRLVSDQMINIFFQEWAPLFPVLHRPTFLALYEQYVASPDSMADKKSIAKLNLVFGIAALSSDPRDGQDVESFEAQWQAASDSFLMDNDLATLECLVLAQIFCMLKADYARVLKYKGLAVGLSQRLGLHQSQKRFALGALTSETRKKVFWSLYTVDCLSAAHLGLPKLLKEEDVHCEYPVDADDEYITEKGFLPTLPGESTKLSSALALFRLARVLSSVLTQLYPASPTHDISLRTIASLAQELDEWSNNLAPHLKLTFKQDKPSTNVTSSRSPILSLAYYHIRSLIYRPALISNLGDKASSAVVAVGDACKHIIQIVQLLDERKLSFSVCINRNDFLVQAGFGLLYQTMNLDRDGKLIKDCNRLVCTVIEMLERAAAPGATEFRRIGCSLISIPRPEQMPTPAPSRQNSENVVAETFRATQKSLKAIAARLSPAALKDGRQLPNEPRRATFPALSPSMGVHANVSSASLSSIRSEPAARSEPNLSPMSQRSSLSVYTSTGRANNTIRHSPSVDVLSFGPDALANYGVNNSVRTKAEVSPADWERLLSSLDSGHTTIYDSIYGGTPADAVLECPPLSAGAETNLTWSPGAWNWNNVADQASAQSVLSFSEDSLASGDEFGNCADFSSATSNDRVYQSIMIPNLNATHASMLAGMDNTYGM